MSSARISIVGMNLLLNQLIASAIRDKLDEVCEIAPAVQSIEGGMSDAAPEHLVLVDDSDARARWGLFRAMADPGMAGRSRVVFALFNVDGRVSDMCSAVRHGVKGLFLLHETIDELLDGVRSLLRGEIRIPAEVLFKSATMGEENGLSLQRSRLTMREIQVIALVATGATNDQIASRLCISTHTVKTHMYNIFQKIGVESRLRAAMWAMQHLREILPMFHAAAVADGPDASTGEASRLPDGPAMELQLHAR